MLGIESTHLKIIAEHSCKRKTQHWSKFHVRLQLKIMLGLTKCEWQVWFKDCSLNFYSFYTELTGSGTGGQWFMYHSLHHNSSTNLWAIHNCKYLEEDSFRACEAPPQNPKNSRSCELTILPFSRVYARRNQEPLNETHEKSLGNTRVTECRALQEGELCEIGGSKSRHLWQLFSDLHPSHKSHPCLCETKYLYPP